MRLDRPRPARLALAALALALAPATARASATVDLFQLTCQSFWASGTSTSPYVTLFAHDLTTNDEWFAIVPVTNGTYSGTVTFPTVAVGDEFDLEVWGSLNLYTSIGDPGWYDEGDYFRTEQAVSNCNPQIPALGPAGLAALAALLALAGWLALRRPA